VQLTEKERWQRREHHELYNMGHLLTAACVHHRVTGKDSFLRIATKLGDYLYRTFQPRPAELAHYGWNPSNIMGLVDLYRASGDSRYLDVAQTFVDMRGSASADFTKLPGYLPLNAGDQNQDRVSLRAETEAVGHGVTATYLYCGAADVYAETGDHALLEALSRIWSDMTQRKLYITGAIGALHWGASKRHDPVHEAFGLPYELPNATAYNETCANIGNAMWNWRMLGLTSEAKYADLMERVLYNSMLSAVSIEGTHFFYTNPLRWHGSEHELLSHDAHTRWYTHSCYCCPPSVARSIAQVHNWAYSVSDAGVWVHLYGSNTLTARLPGSEPGVGAPVKLSQVSDYPWSGQVKITVEEAPEAQFAISLRIPGWADQASITVNGSEFGVHIEPASYATLERTWKRGDEIGLSLPMDVRLLQAHPRVEEARNQVAVMRGPVVYCLESVDLPEGTPVSEVCLPRGAALEPRHRTDLLGGVATLVGEACRIREAQWNDQLYRPLGVRSLERLPITLIPYYAWANRGPCEMTVWMPVV
jgi:DUF1680 family protein